MVHEGGSRSPDVCIERKRLDDARERGVPWKKWGPYLSERQWGTVREDYAITLLVAALCLLAIGKLPLLSAPLVALKRTILASLPASFFATVVDGLH